MIRASTGFKIAVAAVSSALFLIFCELSISLLVPGTVGAALVLFGIAIGYRPAAVLGLFVELAVAALSVEITTLSNVNIWQTSVIGLLVPTSLLTWSVFLAEQTDSYRIDLKTRPFAAALSVGTIFAITVPVAVVLTSFVSPRIADTLPTMVEISLLFVVVSVATLALMHAGEPTESA